MFGKCQNCGLERKLHKHHLKLQSEGGTDVDGIQYLCANCHEDVHGGPCGGGGSNRANHTPEVNLKRSISCRLKWADPEYRERVLAGRALARKEGRRDDKAIGKKIAAAWTAERRALQSRILQKSKQKQFAGKWSMEFDACLLCKSNERPHQANGLCTRCYAREYGRQRRGSLLSVAVK